MPAWGPLLNKDQVYALAAFVISKKDSNPANPKAPQGEEVK
jgi:cytochrome c oxidase cbb3-type subunit 3